LVAVPGVEIRRPLPATTDSFPAGVTLDHVVIGVGDEEIPWASKATPDGALRADLMAGPVSAARFPSPSDNRKLPAGVTSSTMLLAWSAMNSPVDVQRHRGRPASADLVLAGLGAQSYRSSKDVSFQRG